MNIELSPNNKYDEYKKLCSIINYREPESVQECRQLISLIARFKKKYRQKHQFSFYVMVEKLYDRIDNLKNQDNTNLKG